jgi:hypothetical protein
MAIGPYQRKILDTAVANAGIVSPLPRGRKEVRAARALLRRGYLIEARSQPGVLEWRVDREGQVWCLGISDAGRRAIGWTPPRVSEKSKAIGEKLLQIFREANEREPTDLLELEDFIRRELRAAFRPPRY